MRSTAIKALLPVALLSVAACRRATPSPPAKVAVAPAPRRSGAPVERRPVLAEGISRGADGAVIHIVEFGDLQCLQCAEAEPIIARVMTEYAGKVRFYYRNFPLLGMNEDAVPAAEAALAADDQGKFWPMHDKLLANQRALERADLERYAGELGLDLAAFRSALDGHKNLPRIQADMAAGEAAGVPFTPVFFINGRPLGGAQEFPEWKRIIDDELALVDGLLASGTPPDKLYARLMQDAAMPRPPAPPPAASTAIYKVALGGAPVRGAKQPKVTIVEFCDFECPYCKAAQPILEQVLESYGDDVQLAWKHLPQIAHRHSALAALASEAAHTEGRFWEMHDLLFANQAALDRASLETYARRLRLDPARLKAVLDLAQPSGKVVDADAQQAHRLGLDLTPTYFVNGRMLSGVQPFEVWKKLIDEALKKADARLAAGVPREGLYAKLIEGGLEKGDSFPSASEAMPAPSAVAPVRVELGDAPVRGRKDAPVTLVVFSDFQCPFCGKVEPTLARVMDAYEGRVRLVWKDFPLDFHPNAVPAALAARAAGEQGKFWPMHDRLFANQVALDRESLERHAEALGLDRARFRAALDSEKNRAAVLADQRQGVAAGVAGTPAFFINGVKLSGALPFESFKAAIDQELARAKKRVAVGRRGRHP
jgi:protein-disulfide isomerase